MRRREFVTLVCGTVATWPFAARAQQGESRRRVAILIGTARDMLGAQAEATAFLEAFEQLGWTNGRNVRIEIRWGGGNEAELRKYADELIALAPDVILTGGGTAAEVMLKATRTVPAAVLRDPTFAQGIGQFAVIQAVAPSVGIEVSPIDLREPNQIERAIATFAQSPNGGIIMAASVIGAANVDLIIAAAARNKLPAVYVQSFCG
jgi:putative ABC transport system substrate-binding protein